MGLMTEEVRFKKPPIGGGGFIFFQVSRAFGRLTRRTSTKSMQILFRGFLVLSVVLPAQVENLDINTVNPTVCMWGCV